MKQLPHHYRLKSHYVNEVVAMHKDEQNAGFFEIPHFRVAGYVIRVQFSSGMGWEHASVTVAPKGKNATRCPTWEEMCFVKGTFWDENEVVVQYHPAKADYVSFHNFCLHLWRPTGVSLPTPDSLLVGPKLPDPVNHPGRP